MGRRPKSADAPLTPRQRRVLEVINDSIAITGYPPSIREIGNATGLQSTSSVAYQLRELEKKGYLRRDPQKPRALDVHSVRPVPKETRPRTSGMTGGAVPAYGYQEGADLSHHVPPHYIPVIGQVAAGDPILAHQDIEEFFPMPATPEFYQTTGLSFALKLLRNPAITSLRSSMVRPQSRNSTGMTPAFG